MPKYQVTFSAHFVDGKKYRRGDIIEITEEEASKHGSRIQLVHSLQEQEEVEEKPKAKSRKKAVKNEDRSED